MDYKECLHCGHFTDEDEKKCPNCGQNPFKETAIDFSALIPLIKKREIVLSRIWTKNPEKFHEALKGSPS